MPTSQSCSALPYESEAMPGQPKRHPLAGARVRPRARLALSTAFGNRLQGLLPRDPTHMHARMQAHTHGCTHARHGRVAGVVAAKRGLRSRRQCRRLVDWEEHPPRERPPGFTEGETENTCCIDVRLREDRVQQDALAQERRLETSPCDRQRRSTVDRRSRRSNVDPSLTALSAGRDLERDAA